MLPNVYAFDVDETLEISNGPVTLEMVMMLRVEGHIVGICGNWGLFCQRVTGWQHLASFLNCGGTDKETHLRHLRTYVPAHDYILVGNVFGALNKLGVKCGSDDFGAAQRAGWRFIKEDAFADGER